MVLDISFCGLLAMLPLGLWQGRTQWCKEYGKGSYSSPESQEATTRRKLGHGSSTLFRNTTPRTRYPPGRLQSLKTLPPPHSPSFKGMEAFIQRLWEHYSCTIALIILLVTGSGEIFFLKKDFSLLD